MPSESHFKGLCTHVAKRKPSLIGATCWLILNQKGDLSELGGQVLSAQSSGIMQHYFDDLNAKNASERKDWHENILERWIDDNPPVAG